MQQLTTPPMATSPYTPAGGSNMPNTMPQPPKLGTPIPGTTGGLAAKPGLTVFDNPLPQAFQSQPQQAAQQAQQYGRGQDTMLVHMTPNEVNSLRGLAQQFGGDLTQNPHTGLPEAGWLGKLLPTILGALGAMVSIPPVWLLAGGTAVGTAVTGDLGKGLMAGLGAYGGAGLAGAAGLGKTLSPDAFGLLGKKATEEGVKGVGTQVVQQGAQQVATGAPTDLLAQTTNGVGGGIGGAVTETALPGGSVSTVVGDAAQQIATKTPGLFGKFAEATRAGLPSGTPGIISKIAPYAAGYGVLESLNYQPTPKAPEEEKSDYAGPYTAAPRTSVFDTAYANRDTMTGTPAGPVMPSMSMAAPGVMPMSMRGPLDTREKQYFDVVNPIPGVIPATPAVAQTTTQPSYGRGLFDAIRRSKEQSGFSSPIWEDPTKWKGAKGGEVHMDEGSFVMPARETAEFGKGSTDAGQRVLEGLGGIPLKGPGHGTSDSIRARIGGKQEARVANGEVYFPRKAVQRIGGGDHKRGTQKLYAMMKKAEQSRKKAARGADGANLIRGLI